MNSSVKVTTIGNSAGIVLPKKVLAKLRVDKGDILYITETSNGILLSAHRPEIAEQVEVMERVTSRNRDALRMLAK